MIATATLAPSLAALDMHSLAMLAQCSDVTAASSAAREIEARVDRSIERYSHSLRSLARTYSIADAAGRELGTATREGRGAYSVTPAGSRSSIDFDSLAAAREWLRDVAYLAR